MSLSPSKPRSVSSPRVGSYNSHTETTWRRTYLLGLDSLQSRSLSVFLPSLISVPVPTLVLTSLVSHLLSRTCGGENVWPGSFSSSHSSLPPSCESSSQSTFVFPFSLNLPLSLVTCRRLRHLSRVFSSGLVLRELKALSNHWQSSKTSLHHRLRSSVTGPTLSYIFLSDREVTPRLSLLLKIPTRYNLVQIIDSPSTIISPSPSVKSSLLSLSGRSNWSSLRGYSTFVQVGCKGTS